MIINHHSFSCKPILSHQNAEVLGVDTCRLLTFLLANGSLGSLRRGTEGFAGTAIVDGFQHEGLLRFRRGGGIRLGGSFTCPPHFSPTFACLDDISPP